MENTITENNLVRVAYLDAERVTNMINHKFINDILNAINKKYIVTFYKLSNTKCEVEEIEIELSYKNNSIMSIFIIIDIDRSTPFDYLVSYYRREGNLIRMLDSFGVVKTRNLVYLYSDNDFNSLLTLLKEDPDNNVFAKIPALPDSSLEYDVKTDLDKIKTNNSKVYEVINVESVSWFRISYLYLPELKEKFPKIVKTFNNIIIAAHDNYDVNIFLLHNTNNIEEAVEIELLYNGKSIISIIICETPKDSKLECDYLISYYRREYNNHLRKIASFGIMFSYLPTDECLHYIRYSITHYNRLLDLLGIDPDNYPFMNNEILMSLSDNVNDVITDIKNNKEKYKMENNFNLNMDKVKEYFSQASEAINNIIKLMPEEYDINFSLLYDGVCFLNYSV